MEVKTKCTFTIGVPAYKGRFLKDCIESILAQSFKQFELVIVNDCSPEPLDNIVNLFSDSRISYSKNIKNFGAEYVINNWNKCLENAKGDFFILMGDDDRMEPDYLDEFIKLIEKFPNLDVYHCRTKIIDEHSNTVTFTPSWPEYETIYDNIWHRINNGKRSQFISDFVYRTSFLKKNGGFYYLPLAWGSDDITAFIACGEKGIAHVNKPVFNYRKSNLTISNSGNPELKLKAIDLEKQWFNLFLSKKPNNPHDVVLYTEIINIVDKHIQRKKSQVLLASLKSKFFLYSFKWILNYRKFNINLSELNLAIIKALIHKAKLFAVRKD